MFRGGASSAMSATGTGSLLMRSSGAVRRPLGFTDTSISDLADFPERGAARQEASQPRAPAGSAAGTVSQSVTPCREP